MNHVPHMDATGTESLCETLIFLAGNGDVKILIEDTSEEIKNILQSFNEDAAFEFINSEQK